MSSNPRADVIRFHLRPGNNVLEVMVDPAVRECVSYAITNEPSSLKSHCVDVN